MLTHYLETQQEDWRYYDMVWINDLDNDNCNVFVDGTVKSVSCNFMLPAICEMDEHVRLQPPLSVARLPKEVVYAIVAIVIMLICVFVLCCCWCHKTRQRKKERLIRRESIRLSKSSLAGSRSLASVTSTGFSDINYRFELSFPLTGHNFCLKHRIVNNYHVMSTTVDFAIAQHVRTGSKHSVRVRKSFGTYFCFFHLQDLSEKFCFAGDGPSTHPRREQSRLPPSPTAIGTIITTSIRTLVLTPWRRSVPSL